MYKGKYEAPKGTPRPPRARATRRIEDVPPRSEVVSEQTQPARVAQVSARTMPEIQRTPAPQPVPPAEPQAMPAMEHPEKPALRSVSTDNFADDGAMEHLEKPALRSAAKSQGKRAVADRQGEAKAPACKAPPKKRKGKPTKGTVIFYSAYFVTILAFFVLIAGVLSALDDYLVSFEKSQSGEKAQTVFNQHFAQPDWAELYDLAGYTDTAFEGRDQFVSYMTETVGGQPLRYVSTASGEPDRLSKYVLKAGDLRLGTFTLEAEDPSATIKNWVLSEVELPVKREQSVTVWAGSGQTVYINGVPLDQEHIIRTTVTLAEDYIPAGLHGHSSTTFQLDGLLVPPQVEVKDAQGNSVAVTYDEALGQYVAESATPSFTISDTDKATVIAAAKVLSEFRIEAKGETSLARHFDSGSAYYKATVAQDTWMQNYASYKFSDPVVSEYYAYSDSFFSAHVEMKLYVTRNNGTVKEWDASGTFFFTKTAGGKWLVTDSVKFKVQQEVTKVRLRYMLDGELVTYELVDSTSIQLEPPMVQVPEGKVFAGWFRETLDSDGKKVLSLAFKPDETTGLVYLGTGVTLEPMVLHARFEDKGAE